jgi:hypothetical protein
VEHEPLTQDPLLAHTRPQTPQLFGSEFVSTQPPPQQAPLGPMALQPAAQPRATQVLPTQVWVAASQQVGNDGQAMAVVGHLGLLHTPCWHVVLHTCWHAPQLVLSDPLVTTQVPPQHCWPAPVQSVSAQQVAHRPWPQLSGAAAGQQADGLPGGPFVHVCPVGQLLLPAPQVQLPPGPHVSWTTVQSLPHCPQSLSLLSC